MIYGFISYYLNYIYNLCCISSSKNKKNIEKEKNIINDNIEFSNLSYHNYKNLFYLTYDFNNINLKYFKKSYKTEDIITFDLISKIKREPLSDSSNIYFYNKNIYKIGVSRDKNNYINILKSLYYNKLNNIVLPKKIFNSINSKETIQIFEYYKDGDLFDYLFGSNFKLKYYDIYNIILKLAQCIKNIHNINISHRDIKFENFLIKRKEKKLELFLTDFEFATFSSISVNFRGGTFNYAAPELFKKDKIYDFKPSDVWSFCVMLYSITVGHYPWEKATYDCEVFTDYMCNPNLLLYDVLKSNIPVNHKVKYMKILKRGFNLNHNERINMNEIVDILNNK